MDKQQQKQLTVFGYGLPLILVFLGARHGFKHSWDMLSFVLFTIALLVFGIALFAKPFLVKIFKCWMKVAHFIGMVVTGVMLTVLYFLVFTPVACVLRLMGKDFMRRRWQAQSYWIPKQNAESETNTKQF